MGNYFSNEVAVQKKNDDIAMATATTSAIITADTTTEIIPPTPNNTEVDPKRSLSTIPEEIVEEIKEYFNDLSGVTGVIEEAEKVVADSETAIEDTNKVIEDVKNIVNDVVETIENEQSIEKNAHEIVNTEQQSPQVKKNKKKKHKTH
jgi:hypothetical protein